jgi:S-adenosylmethionine:tRNA ribosyltransferase-isomerase
MKPASSSQRFYENTKLAVIDANAAGSASGAANAAATASPAVAHHTLQDFGNFLQKGDLLVVNRSGTLPSSFHGHLARTGEAVELRLASFQGLSSQDLSQWKAVSFGSGDWRMPTEARGPAPKLIPGDRIKIGPGYVPDNGTQLEPEPETEHELEMRITQCDPRNNRLVDLQFHISASARVPTPSLIELLFRWGKPIQYSYLSDELKVWDQQTLFSGPPISVEPASASFQLTWKQLLQLQSKGIEIATVLHGAGLSSTGDPALDALLPLSEYCEIPAETLAKVAQAHAGKNRVVAIGTSATRALESVPHEFFSRPFFSTYRNQTELRLGAHNRPRYVNAMLTGMHEPGTSHHELMNAFIETPFLHAADLDIEARGYRGHEYGDLSLILARPDAN